MPSHVLMGITKAPQVLPTMLSPLGKACAKMDLTAVHDILLKTGYKDEEGAENEVWCSCFLFHYFIVHVMTQYIFEDMHISMYKHLCIYEHVLFVHRLYPYSVLHL